MTYDHMREAMPRELPWAIKEAIGRNIVVGNLSEHQALALSRAISPAECDHSSRTSQRRSSRPLEPWYRLWLRWPLLATMGFRLGTGFGAEDAPKHDGAIYHDTLEGQSSRKRHQMNLVA
jgi:hypothetical protein